MFHSVEVLPPTYFWIENKLFKTEDWKDKWYDKVGVGRTRWDKVRHTETKIKKVGRGKKNK